MAQRDFLKRYLDTGLALGQLTRARAEEVVKDLVKAGEVQRKQQQQFVDALLDRSRKNAEMLAAVVSAEVRKQLDRAMGTKGQDAAPKPAPARKSTTSKMTAKKAAPAKKAAAKKTTATKTTAKKAAPAKKAPAPKAPPGAPTKATGA